MSFIHTNNYSLDLREVAYITIAQENGKELIQILLKSGHTITHNFMNNQECDEAFQRLKQALVRAFGVPL